MYCLGQYSVNYMYIDYDVAAGLRYSFIVQSFSLIYTSYGFGVTPAETEKDNNNKKKMMKNCKNELLIIIYLGGYLCKFNHTSGKHAYRQWLLGGCEKGWF